ncbi:MAG: DNA-binding response regulator [Flavobacteriia bacterium]|nr:DNA-binding response regulator [Flavobacteriia bacterium]
MARIGIVEDDKVLKDFIQLNLQLEGYMVQTFDSGIMALESLTELLMNDLIILDNMLPGLSGVDVCQEIRKVSEIPILFLSAKSNTQDRIEGLRAGANDYLAKPFDLEELILRVQVLLPKTNHLITIGTMEVDLENYTVKNSQKNNVHSFSKKEVALLKLFLQNENKVLAREEILDKVWGEDAYPTSRTIDNFVLTFRKVFEPDQKTPQYFHSIRGIGYKFTNPKP